MVRALHTMGLTRGRSKPAARFVARPRSCGRRSVRSSEAKGGTRRAERRRDGKRMGRRAPHANYMLKVASADVNAVLAGVHLFDRAIRYDAARLSASAESSSAGSFTGCRLN